jgi:hypothetical protein
VTVTLAWDGTRPVLRTVPNNLLAAVWYQFARHVADRADHRQCLECGSGFTVRPTDIGRTQRKRYCGDPCRKAAYRSRKAWEGGGRDG